MRRLYLTLAICCSIVVGSVAQEITVTTDTLEKKVANRNYQYQSLDQYNQWFLLKLGAQQGFVYALNYQLRDIPFDLIALEFRLSKSISLEGTYFFPEEDLSAFSFKLRHYLKKGRLANNMSGRYVALEYSNRLRNAISFDEVFQLQFGKQIKKSQFSYADFSVFSSYHNSVFNRSFNLGLNMMVGAAWGPVGKRSKLPLPTEPEKSLSREHFLVTLENPSIILGDRYHSYSLATTQEKELLLQGLTVRTTVSGGYFREIGKDEFFSTSMSFAVSAGARKYIGLLKKPNAEYPVQSFAGLYVGLGVNDLFTYLDFEFDNPHSTGEESRHGFDRLIPFLELGYQERIGRRYFFDVFVNYLYYTYDSFLISKTGNPYLSFGTRVGLNWGR